MKKIFLSISVLYLTCFSSCIIERPLPGIAPLKTFEENKAFYINKENKFVLVMECWRSYDDSDYIKILLTLENFSDEKILCRFREINIYREDYLFKARENYPMYKGRWEKDMSKVEGKEVVFKPNESVTYSINYFPFVKDKSYDELLSKMDSDILVNNIILEINGRQLNVPEFYFRY